MNERRLTLWIVALLVTVAGAAHADAAGASRTVAGPRLGPVAIVEVTASDATVRDDLIHGGYDVANVRGDVLTIFATPEEVAELKALGLPMREVGRPLAPPETVDLKAKAAYHSYAGVTSALADYAAAYPSITRLYTLGKSVQNRELWALLITDNPDIQEDEPEFKYISTIHGLEPVGVEMCLYLIDRLLTDYGQDVRITHLVDTTAIWIVPLMNPDGLENGTRVNANGFDLNRSFPEYPEDFAATYYNGGVLSETGWQPEVAHVMDWTVANSFVLSANFHTGALVVNYPYDDDGLPSGTDAPTPDDLLFEDISRRYSIHNTPMWNSPYFDDGITNGTAWYFVGGGMQDWNYRYVGCNEVTIELSDTFKPSASLLPTLWADNEESMLSYLEAVHIGIRGVVTDGHTGDPVWAEILVDDNPQPVYTDPDVGDYHRMLLPGTYDLKIAADGFIAQTWQNIVVGNETATRVDTVMLDADINDDGNVDAVDIQLVVNAVLGYDVAYPCDVDGDGVAATDLQHVINAFLGRH